MATTLKEREREMLSVSMSVLERERERQGERRWGMNYVAVGQCKDGLLMMQLEVSCSEWIR